MQKGTDWTTCRGKYVDSKNKRGKTCVGWHRKRLDVDCKKLWDGLG